MAAGPWWLDSEVWGLDPLFRTHVKMYIRDVHEMIPYPSDINPTGQSPDQLPPVLNSKLSEAVSSYWKSQQGFDLGDLVQVRGRVKVFRNVREISTSYIAKLDDLSAEVVRMLELPKLYRDVYDQPFVLPADILQQIGNREKHKAARLLKNEIVEYCRLHQVLDFYTEELESVNQLSLDGSRCHSLFTKAVRLMEEEGMIYAISEMAHAKKYKVLVTDTALCNDVCHILRKECTLAKYMDKGCHYLHILDELRMMLPYSQLTRPALMWCLKALEERSEIISTTNQHYIPVG